MPKNFRKRKSTGNHHGRTGSWLHNAHMAAQAADTIGKAWKNYKSKKATKSKKSNSHTRTKTKTKTIEASANPQVVGVAKFRSGNVLHKYSKLDSDKYTSVTNLQRHVSITPFNGVTANRSEQNYSNVGNFYTGNFIQSLYNNAANNAVGTVWPNTQSVTAGYGVKVYLQKLVQTYEFTNQTQGNSLVSMYILKAKRDAVTFDNPTSAWGVGNNDQSGLTTTYRTYIDADPRESKLFNETWSVVKKVNFELGPGKVQQYTHTCYTNKMVDLELAQNYGTIKGLTHAVLMVYRGTPVDDDKGLETVDSKITPKVGHIFLNEQKLIGFCKTNATFRALVQPPRNLKETSTMWMKPGNTTDTVTVAYDVQDVSGAVVDLMQVASAVLGGPA